MEAVIYSLCRAADMVFAFPHVVDYHAIGADQAVHQRLDGYGTKAHLGIGDHHPSLDNVTGYHSHFQSAVYNLQVQPVLCYFGGNYFILVGTSKQWKHRRGDLHVVDAPVPVREQRPCHAAGAVVHGSDHVAVFPVSKPCVDVLG